MTAPRRRPAVRSSSEVVVWWLALLACGGPPPQGALDASLPPPSEGGPAAAVEIGGVPATSLPDVAERVNRSVVAIAVEKPMSGVGRPRGFFDVPQHRSQDGVGSGVVVRADGVVLTNHHVVDGATKVEVTLWDGHHVAATVVGSDAGTDVAVLRLAGPPPGLEPIDLGRSETLRVGEGVLAVGNPFGVGQTVTLGIVSGLGRTGLGLAEYEDFIQTDAAVNPGNSGGALVDLRGRLVGINSAIRSESGGNEGIAFAIPVDRARRIAEMLLERGRVDRGFLGVSMQPADDALADSLGVPPGGVVVTDVLPGSPAAAAGFLAGDVIVALDGREVRDLHRFRYEVATSGAGHPFRAGVLRGGERLELSGELGAIPGDAAPSADTDRLGGARLLALDAATRRDHGIPDRVEGLLVADVGPGPLADAGLGGGDVILDVDHRPVADPAAFARAWTEARGGGMLLRVWRAGDVRFVGVGVP